MATIYLDNSMTTCPSPKAVTLMLPFLSERWGTPSAPHAHGQVVVGAAKDAYQKLYQLFDAEPQDTVVFTSSGAEGVNHVFSSTYMDVTLPTGKNQFLTAATDEAPALMAASRVEKMGCVHKIVKVNDDGIVTPDAVADMMTPRTALVSLSWGNGMTGVIQPVEEIATLCQERGVLLHLEGSHILGKHFFERDDVGADFITCSGDLFHAPQGTGALYAKRGVPLSPFITGGLEQGGRRAGNLNVASLVSLGEAAKEALEAREYMCTEVARLRDRFEKLVLEGYPEAIPLFQKQRRLPHCTAIAFRGVSNEALLFALNQNGVYSCIGGGSFQQIGLNLEAAGVDSLLAQTAVSFTLSRETREEEIEQAAALVIESAKKLRVGSTTLVGKG